VGFRLPDVAILRGSEEHEEWNGMEVCSDSRPASQRSHAVRSRGPVLHGVAALATRGHGRVRVRVRGRGWQVCESPPK
jgi:hypothetical protein